MKTVFIVFSIDPSSGMRIQDVFSSEEAADQAARTLRGRGLSVGVQGWVLKEEFLGFFDAPIYLMPVESKKLETSLLKFRDGQHSYSVIDNGEEEELLDLTPSSSNKEASLREFQIGDIVRIKDSALALDFLPYSRGQIVEKHLKGYYAVKEENGCTYFYPGHWLTLVAGVEKTAPAQAVLSERAQEKPQHTPETVKLLEEIKAFADSAARYMELERHRSRLPMRYEMYLVMNLLDDIKKNVKAILEGKAPDRPPGPQHPPRVPGHNPVA